KGKIVADDSLARLKSAGPAEHLVKVQFSASVDPSILSAVPGITHVEAIPPAGYNLFTSDPDAAKKGLLKISLENNLDILSLQTQSKSLEEIFKSLTGNIQNN
ncbi:MAG: gliding motility-associated ABC transporter ATP-binding subunit GldA, partial [Bacteroidota bacterium]|nr:gliding motility-associated ABC transporter ATP-binding subunit GldA [Bacteroidota bacterium]